MFCVCIFYAESIANIHHQSKGPLRAFDSNAHLQRVLLEAVDLLDGDVKIMTVISQLLLVPLKEGSILRVKGI